MFSSNLIEIFLGFGSLGVWLRFGSLGFGEFGVYIEDSKKKNRAYEKKSIRKKGKQKTRITGGKKNRR